MKHLITFFIINLIFYPCFIYGQKISSGPGSIIYICPDSTISAIGLNKGYYVADKKIGAYQLGDGTDINRNCPVKVKGIHDVISLNALTSMALLSDGTIWKWTDDTLYNLHKINIDSVIAISGGVSAINLDFFYCAVRQDGSLWLWGDSERKDDHWWGYTDSLEKMDIPKVKKVATGQQSVIALCEDGTVWTWGNIHVDGNRNDTPDTFFIYKPSRVYSITDVKDIGAGIMDVFVLKNDGTVWEWGMEQSHHTVGGRSFPVKLNISNVKSISVGYQDALYAFKEDGSLWYWPDSIVNTHQFARHDTYPKKIETPVNFETVVSSKTNTYAYDSSGNLYRWGQNEDGQLGNFTTFPIDSPEIMPQPCVAVDCDTITLNPDILKLDTFVYPGVPVHIEASVSEADLYWWYPRTNLLSGKYNREAVVNISEDTEFSAVLMDLYGCMRKERFMLRKKCDPDLRFIIDSVTYPGAYIDLYTGEGVNYVWSPIVNLSCSDCRNPVVSITDSITYNVTYDNIYNCPAEEKYVFRIRNCDTIIESADRQMLDTLITPGNPVILKASDGISYNWTPSTGLSCYSCQDPVVHIYENTEFAVLITDNYNCQWTERYNIKNNCDSSTLTNPELILDTIVYPQVQLNLRVPQGKYYLWQPQQGLSCSDCSDPVVSIEGPVEYVVTITDNYNCNQKASYRILVRNCDTIVLQNNMVILDTIIHYPTEIPLLASSSFNGYSWLPDAGLSCSDCQNPILSAKATSDYIVKIYDQWHCPFNEIFKITMIKTEVVIPNVFTPNYDGINDFFDITGLVPNTSLKIYDSKGILVFEAENYEGDWDGKDKNGNPLNEGTYWYNLNIPESELYQGWVYIKR